MDPCVLPSSRADLLKTSKVPSTTPKKIVLSAAKKRKAATASGKFALVFVHDPGSFQQRITSNTKCLQIARFLMGFIFSTRDHLLTEHTTIELYLAMFASCYSSRKFIQLCHSLLILFDGPSPKKAMVHELSHHLRDANFELYETSGCPQLST